MDSDFSHNQLLFENYHSEPGVFDEFFDSQGEIHEALRDAIQPITQMDKAYYHAQQKRANYLFRRNGVTFTVYSDKRGIEKIFPFDLIPRVIPSQEWSRLERGLCQRLVALNAFLQDIYSHQHIISAKIIPKELVYSSKGFIPLMQHIRPLGGVYIHIAGIDLVKDQRGDFLVLEDNLRSPSGVSYVLENRLVMKQLFSEVLENTRVRSVDDYPFQLFHALSTLSKFSTPKGRTVILTPGIYNSAYFEHAYLARKMGCDLVSGSDLFVENKKVFLKTMDGPKPVSVIYRRIDDDFLDPNTFNPQSLLGVPDLIKAYAAGNVLLANAVGNGVADDKAIYHYVPAMIKFYLNEDPILPQIETFSCSDPKSCDYVIKNIEKMVVKSVDLSGGYGMLIGAQASHLQRQEFIRKIKAAPRYYIAQPLVELSMCPTLTDQVVSPCRVDFRPYIVMGEQPWVLPGGLTRVALEKGSYVVNSSQGGGSKDTWVLEARK